VKWIAYEDHEQIILTGCQFAGAVWAARRIV
jgi:hypothetical protein